MTDATIRDPLSRRIAAEIFGTYLLVFSVLGSALLFTPDNGGALPVALAIGISVFIGIVAVGAISGGHFNPAVTLGAAIARRTPWSDVLPYWGGQIVGGVLAALTLGLFGVLGGISLDFGAVSNGYDAHSPLGFTLGAVLVAEIVATLLFVLVILGATARRTGVVASAALAIGLALAMLHMVMIPVSNAALNPVRALAPALLGGPEALAQLWVFILAPLAGGLLAGLLSRPLFGEQD